MNENPFEHVSRFGTKFTAERCDFQGGVIVEKELDINSSEFLCDVSEMIGFHATNIWPNLNGFQGYDCISFKVNVKPLTESMKRGLTMVEICRKYPEQVAEAIESIREQAAESQRVTEHLKGIMERHFARSDDERKDS